jgi:phosphate transport system protein
MAETHFVQQLEELKLKILKMSAYADRAVQNATNGLLERDSRKAEKIIEQDSDINDIECRIDEYCLELLAREQPVARDLRFITGCMRIIIDLERIGDEAVNIAEKTIFLSRLPDSPHNSSLEELTEVARAMLRGAIDSFREQDPDKALDVCRMDNRADDLNVRVLKQTMDDMVSETTGVRRAVNTILASRALERIADLSTNVAESTIFIVRGVSIKHQCHRF